MILRLEDICYEYENGNGKVALDRVSLELGRGQIMGIYGPSGSGKTTLLKAAAGLLQPSSGSVIYDGAPLYEMSSGERQRFLRQEIAYLGKDATWASWGVLEYVEIRLLVNKLSHRVARRRAKEALLACEVDQFANTELGKLSDGERQRVAIASALVAEPRLLIADGPGSKLSLIEQETMMALLLSLAHEAKTAVLIADGNAEALLGASPILCLADGKLINPEPIGERGQIVRLPTGGSHRTAADA